MSGVMTAVTPSLTLTRTLLEQLGVCGFERHVELRRVVALDRLEQRRHALARRQGQQRQGQQRAVSTVRRHVRVDVAGEEGARGAQRVRIVARARK